MRPINPGRSARGKRAYTETHVNSAGAIRVTNIGANNAMAQNLQLDADEFDAAVASLLGKGAGRDLTLVMAALRVRGFGTDVAPETKPAKGEPEKVAWDDWTKAQDTIAELERQLADIKEGQAWTTADAEADEDEETYFKRIVESIAETPSYLAMLNAALTDRGMMTTGLAVEPGADVQDGARTLWTGIMGLPVEQVQVDLTTLAQGGQQVAIRINPEGDPANDLIDRYLKLCKDRGIPIKKRIQRAAPAKKSSSG